MKYFNIFMDPEETQIGHLALSAACGFTIPKVTVELKDFSIKVFNLIHA